MTMKKTKLNKLASFLWPDISVKMIRVGPNEDGGYVLPAAAYQQTKHVISFGVNVDWRFERQLHRELNVSIQLYEAKSVLKLILRFWIGGAVKLLIGKTNLHSFKDRSNRIFDYYKFFSRRNIRLEKQWINNNSATSIFHACPYNTLLKCDIEGGEYDILDCIIRNSEKFHIIVIEIHDINKNLKKIEAFTKKIKESFYLIHLHTNNSSSIDKNKIPEVAELTFARKSSIMDFSPPSQMLPIPGIDFPSVHSLADHIIVQP